MSNLLLKTRDFTKKKTNGQAENYPEGFGKSQCDWGKQNSELHQFCDDSISGALLSFILAVLGGKEVWVPPTPGTILCPSGVFSSLPYHLLPKVVIMFGKFIELSWGGVLLEEMDHWGLALRFPSLDTVPVCFLLPDCRHSVTSCCRLLTPLFLFHSGLSASWTVSQNGPSPLKWLLANYLISAMGKVTNAPYKSRVGLEGHLRTRWFPYRGWFLLVVT